MTDDPDYNLAKYEQLKEQIIQKPRNPKGAGRKPRELDWDMIGRLCQIFCTLKETAAVTGYPERTIEDHLRRMVSDEFPQGMKWSDYFEEHSCGGKATLRRAQMALALGGNPTMLIWLGKQFLGQKDEQSYNHGITVQVVKLSELTPGDKKPDIEAQPSKH